ncbi:hypothetical protein EAG_13027 [Camponotus floridanus]|uniref:Uncharacterized protein n=1 Tax=Camponotus floridanus TaxID=104421 RepID=E2ARI8_CAMFO|nr:hypothetical protein EAG_13027 [Camponotus floridanus]
MGRKIASLRSYRSKTSDEERAKGEKKMKYKENETKIKFPIKSQSLAGTFGATLYTRSRESGIEIGSMRYTIRVQIRCCGPESNPPTILAGFVLGASQLPPVNAFMTLERARQDKRTRNVRQILNIFFAREAQNLSYTDHDRHFKETPNERERTDIHPQLNPVTPKALDHIIHSDTLIAGEKCPYVQNLLKMTDSWGGEGGPKKRRGEKRGGRGKKAIRLTETKLPEVSTADFLADPEVRADHEHVGRRGDAVPGRVDVRPGGVPASPRGPLRVERDLLLALGVARPELLIPAVVAPFLHLVTAVVIHGCGREIYISRAV